MFSVPHLVVIFIVVLVVFGPHKLPELARGLGKMMAEFRKASTDFKLAFEEEMRNIERQAREAELKKVQDAAVAAATGTAEQPATLPALSDSERILPPADEPIEPTIAPVSEAVPREPTLFDEPISETAHVNGETIDATTSEPQAHEDPAVEHTEPSDLPIHDQRRPT